MLDLSPLIPTLNGKTVAIYGLDPAGWAMAQALRAAGRPPVVSDDDTAQRTRATAEGFRIFTPDQDIWDDVALLVVGPDLPLYLPDQHPVVGAAVHHGIEIVGEIELFTRANTGHRTICVTGSFGKTTTTGLIEHILNTCDRPAVIIGHDTPSLFIAPPAPGSILVIEMSAYRIDLSPSFHPTITVHLNLTDNDPDLLIRHGSLAHYILMKERMFDQAGIGICSVDDALSSGIFDRAVATGERRMIPVSCTHALNDGISLSGAEVVDTTFHGGVVGSLSGLPHIQGPHGLQDALMAYAAAHAVGLEPAEIFHALESFTGPHNPNTVAA